MTIGNELRKKIHKGMQREALACPSCGALFTINGNSYISGRRREVIRQAIVLRAIRLVAIETSIKDLIQRLDHGACDLYPDVMERWGITPEDLEGRKSTTEE